MFVERFHRRWCEAISRTIHPPLQRLLNQQGSAAVDYAVIVVFIVLALMVVIASLQGRGEAIFQATATVIGDFGSIKTE